jgi:hypothetical protein
VNVSLIFLRSFLLLISAVSLEAFASPELVVSQQVWIEFSNSEKATILSKFPQIEIIPSETVGIIQSVQAVNRSTQGTSAGTTLGGALAQTLYIDNAFKGNGSHYSATSQLGAALLGSALGSTLDSAPQIRYVSSPLTEIDPGYAQKPDPPVARERWSVLTV